MLSNTSQANNDIPESIRKASAMQKYNNSDKTQNKSYALLMPNCLYLCHSPQLELIFLTYINAVY